MLAHEKKIKNYIDSGGAGTPGEGIGSDVPSSPGSITPARSRGDKSILLRDFYCTDKI